MNVKRFFSSDSFSFRAYDSAADSNACVPRTAGTLRAAAVRTATRRAVAPRTCRSDSNEESTSSRCDVFFLMDTDDAFSKRL